MPKFKDGTEIIYTVTEDSIENHITMIDGFNITNTYSPGEISGTVTKHWEDGNNQDKIRPESVKIQLYSNGKKQGKPVDVTKENNWTYTWKKLRMKDDHGKTIQYTIKEAGTVTGYTSKVTGKNTGNLLITNTHTPEKPNLSNQLDKKNNSNTPNHSKNLPNSGEKKSIGLIIAGVALISCLGGYLYLRKMRDRT